MVLCRSKQIRRTFFGFYFGHTPRGTITSELGNGGCPLSYTIYLEIGLSTSRCPRKHGGCDVTGVKHGKATELYNIWRKRSPPSLKQKTWRELVPADANWSRLLVVTTDQKGNAKLQTKVFAPLVVSKK